MDGAVHVLFGVHLGVGFGCALWQFAVGWFLISLLPRMIARAAGIGTRERAWGCSPMPKVMGQLSSYSGAPPGLLWPGVVRRRRSPQADTASGTPARRR